MGPEWVLLAGMVMAQPKEVDANLLVTYTDHQTQASQHLDRLLKQKVPAQYIEWGGYTGYLINLAATRRVAYKMEF